MATITTTKTGTASRTSQTLGAKKVQEAIAGYAFILPAVVILLFFLIIPLFVSAYYSLTNWDGLTPLSRGLITADNPNGAFDFVGLDNYARLLIREGVRQESFYISLKNTVYYVIGVVPVQTVLALLLAVILNQKWLKGKGFFRTTFYFPSISSSVVITLIFMFLFSTNGIVNQGIQGIAPSYQPLNWLDNQNGVLHQILGVFGITRDTLGEVGRTEIASIRIWDWLSGPSVTMLMVMILNIWTTIGTMMVIYLAALQGIPAPVYEAAFVDGANAWQTFRKITVPLLAPTTFFILTIGLIGAFQVFDQIYVLSSGGDTTTTISYLVFTSAFQDRHMGLGAATAIVLFIIIFLFTLFQRRFVSDRNRF